MKAKIKAIEYGPVALEFHGYKGTIRWVENASRGLRLVGFADDIVSLRHKGWFTHDDGDGDEVYRGIVYQLPARDGKEQYVYGYADPNNDDCALLCFDVEEDKADAARNADNFAERFADETRAYNRTWEAGARYRDLDDEIKTMRREALQIGTEMRAVRKASDPKLRAPKLCATLRNEIMSIYRRIQKLRKERAELFDSFGHLDGFTE